MSRSISNKGQAATEFMVIFTFMLMVFLSYLAVMQQRAIDISIDADRQLLQQMGEVIKNKLDTAAFVENGFRYKFTLPRTILGKDYNIILCPYYEQYTSDNIFTKGTCLNEQGIRQSVMYPELVLSYADINEKIVVKISRYVAGKDDMIQNAIDSGSDICLSKENNVVYMNSDVYLC
ncbi:MAG: hypothetical protein WC471_02065 [Candidatus Woesearchaeota archaeon]